MVQAAGDGSWIGVNIGSSFFKGSVLTGYGRAQMLEIGGQGKELLPSVFLQETKNNFLIGDDVLNKINRNYEYTIHDFNKMVGRRFADKELQSLQDSVKFKIEKHRAKFKIVVKKN